jgi:hypothetical protein
MLQQTGKIDLSTIILSEGGDFKRTLSLLNGTTTDGVKSDAMTTWSRLVAQYSRRALTESNDRLPAIAGIAIAMQKISKYTYIAGIWKEDLRGLLWTKAFNQPLGPSPYLAPSWSWASSTSPVSMCFGDEQPIAKVGSRRAELVQSQINNVGKDCYGQVRDGYIIIKAPTVNIEYHQERYAIKGFYGTGIILDTNRVRTSRVQLSLSWDIGFGDGELDTIDKDLFVEHENLVDLVYMASIEHGAKTTPGHSRIGDVVLYLSPAKIKKCLAIWIVEGSKPETTLPLNGFINYDPTESNQGALYCLLVVEDAIQLGKWRRIGVGKSIHHHDKEIEWEERTMCLI